MSSQRVAVFLPSLEGGGAERVIVNLITGLCERGVDIDLILARAEGPYLRLVPPAVRIIDLRASRVLMALLPLVRYLRRERPVALLSALDHANVIAVTAVRLSRVPTKAVISVHCMFERTGFRVRLVTWLLGRLHRWADAITAVSEGVADDVVRTAGVPRHRVQVIPNAVIMPTLLAAAAAPPAHPWFLDQSLRVVLGVGRLTGQKNFPMLIEAFAMAERPANARLLIIGEGPLRQDLEALIERLGVTQTVALPGFVENPYACMAKATVFVLSSDFEGLPTVLIESLAVGTPVIATDCESGPREILRDGTLGELVPVGDVEALSGAISRALARQPSPPVGEALREFTLDDVAARFQAILSGRREDPGGHHTSVLGFE
jgi:glycosyltransferase involved in cell wall biosynthesis